MRPAGLAVLLACAPAVADSSVVTALPSGASIEIERGRLTVTRKGVRAPLGGQPAASVTAVEPARGRVHIRYEDACGDERELELTSASLDARLENAAALSLHRKKRYADAERGFARALAIDPDFDLAATNLASARAMQGKHDAAVAAIAPLLAARPIAIYARMLADPELAPLLDDPKIAAARAKTPGTARLRLEERIALDARAAVSGDRIALVHTDNGWGTCNWDSELQVFDGGGALAASLPLAGAADERLDDRKCLVEAGARAAVEARIAAANRLLADLGFSAAPDLEVAQLSRDPEKGTRQAFFARARLGVADDGNGPARVFRGNHELASRALGGHLDDALFVPRPRSSTLIIQWARAGREGCEGVDPTGFELIRIESK